MIYTVTLNPAVDYYMYPGSFTPGSINRSSRETVLAGGKGINVSQVLKTLGVPSVATGFLGGFSGGFIEAALHNMGIAADFVHLADGITRINVKLRYDSETDVNAGGPAISPEAFLALCEKVSGLTASDTLVLSGAAAPGLDTDCYEKLAAICERNGTRFVVDAEKKWMFPALCHHPFFVKPNHEELAAMTGLDCSTEEAILDAGRTLLSLGAQNVLVSRAEKGAILLCSDGTAWLLPAPSGVLVSSTGAGDSTVAGFLAGYEKTGDLRQSFRLAVACGSATAFCAGLAASSAVEALLSRLPEPEAL